MTAAVDTDMIAETRSDLVAVLESLGIAYHDTEPRSLGEAPAAWFGRPALSYDPFEHRVNVDWSCTLAGHPVDPEQTTHDFDRTVWELWRALGLGRQVAASDAQRTAQAIEARPATVTVGDVAYPVYEIQIRTSVHIGIC